jgi:queuine tRNA-ribosyltransferase
MGLGRFTSGAEALCLQGACGAAEAAPFQSSPRIYSEGLTRPERAALLRSPDVFGVFPQHLQQRQDKCAVATIAKQTQKLMSIEFHVETSAGAARAGRLLTPHGEIETPVFMPVGTAATVKAVPQDVLEELGVQILLGNTYHLYLRPGVETVRHFGGLHGFMAWPRAILTDSGGFQVFSLNELRKVNEEGVTFRSHLDGSSHFFSPENSMAAQIGLGADIIMAFDECTEYPADRARTQASMELTLRWAERSKKYFEEHKQEVPWDTVSSFQFPVSGAATTGNQKLETRNSDSSQSLFGIVQGGMDLDLRKESAERTIEIGFPGYAIGGLSVGEPRELTREVIEATLEYLPKDKPRYVMGVGTPEEIVEYAKLGVDMMDCVLPTRAARHGLLFTSEGKISIKQARYAQDAGPLDPNCACRVCRRYSRAYLRHLYASNEVLAQVLNTLHNLSFYLDTMRRVRHSIRLGEESRFF